MQFWIVISVLHPVHPGFFIKDIPSVAEGIQPTQSIHHTAGLAHMASPCIVLVFYNKRSIAVNNANDITQGDLIQKGEPRLKQKEDSREPLKPCVAYGGCWP